ncbi:MAG: hypothetical protein LC101_06070 [Flavobacteriales bacterium]|nr:hypothetical protein [Flavobacteriales bacterium]
MILSDYKSWINPAIYDLQIEWAELGHQVFWHHSTNELPVADFCFCLSFSKIIDNRILANYKHTLVVHESDLPQGKGWSPLTWQIIEGKNRIPVTLIEAAEQVDSGIIYAQTYIDFEGHELVNELRKQQAQATLYLCREFIDNYPLSTESGQLQQGEESFYARRRPADSLIDIDKSLNEQFDLLRVVDNENYPAFFKYKDFQYHLKIEKIKD